MALPTCECFKGLAPNDKADAIYCALYSAIAVPEDLPTCECVEGLPLMDKVNAIYCALLQFVEAGGGPVNINNVLGMTPAGLGLITTLPTPVSAENVVLISPANSAVIIEGFTGTQTPVTLTSVDRGVVTLVT